MTETVQLNLNKELYTSTSHNFIGILSPKSKHLLTLPEEERTGSAFSELLSEMENMDFFSQFTSRTKELLAKKLKFVTHKASTILLRQNVDSDPPQALYIILSGVITEHYKPAVSNSGSPVLWPEKNIKKVDYFGHVDIIYNRPPTVGAVTVCYSELLKLPKEDFYIVRKEMEAHCVRANHYLRTSEAIARFGWSEEEYKVLEIYSKLCTFVKNQDVYAGVENKKPSWSYFIVLGSCKIARELTYCVSDSGQLKAVSYHLHKELSKVLTDRIEFEEVKQGFYFGVGENFVGNHVIANSTLECLLISRLLLVFKNRELLQKMAKDLTESLLSDQEVLDNYSKLISESKRKVKMFKEMFKDKPEILIKD